MYVSMNNFHVKFHPLRAEDGQYYDQEIGWQQSAMNALRSEIAPRRGIGRRRRRMDNQYLVSSPCIDE